MGNPSGLASRVLRTAPARIPATAASVTVLLKKSRLVMPARYTILPMRRARRDESQTLRALLQMRELLLRGEFRSGERIREIPLAARLHVSRTPLRLVLGRLEEEGLVAARPTGGFVASEFSVRD